jgi:hypothetical protein
MVLDESSILRVTGFVVEDGIPLGHFLCGDQNNQRAFWKGYD